MGWRTRRAEDELASARDALRSLPDRIRPDFRRAVVFGVLAVAALIVGNTYGDPRAHSAAREFTAWGCALAALVFGVVATRSAADELRRITIPRAGLATASALRVGGLLIGYAVALLFALDILDVPLGSVLVGGTVAGIIVGIAAQQALGNLFAGLVLLFARPYVPGQRITLYSGALGGPHVGIVSSVGLLYTSLDTDAGLINVPNSGLLASAVGPAPSDAADGTATDAAEVDVTSAADPAGARVEPPPG